MGHVCAWREASANGGPELPEQQLAAVLPVQLPCRQRLSCDHDAPSGAESVTASDASHDSTYGALPVMIACGSDDSACLPGLWRGAQHTTCC